jgi:hypothetical protein
MAWPRVGRGGGGSRRQWWAWLGMALGSVGTFGVCGHAQVKVPKVPLVHLWVEAEGHRDAGRWTEAAGLAERVLQRAEQGEAMPAGLGLNQVRLLAAGWALRAGALAVAEAQARRVLESPKDVAWHGEGAVDPGCGAAGIGTWCGGGDCRGAARGRRAVAGSGGPAARDGGAGGRAAGSRGGVARRARAHGRRGSRRRERPRGPGRRSNWNVGIRKRPGPP